MVIAVNFYGIHFLISLSCCPVLINTTAEACTCFSTFSPRRRPTVTPPLTLSCFYFFLFFFLHLFLLHLLTFISLTSSLTYPNLHCRLLNFFTLFTLGLSTFLILLFFLFIPLLLSSFPLSPGVVPEQENEGQTAETLLAMASPSC